MFLFQTSNIIQLSVGNRHNEQAFFPMSMYPVMGIDVIIEESCNKKFSRNNTSRYMLHLISYNTSYHYITIPSLWNMIWCFFNCHSWSIFEQNLEYRSYLCDRIHSQNEWSLINNFYYISTKDKKIGILLNPLK